jgi:metallo-beta-lactamase family protein
VTFSITFLGATEQVTGSLYQINAGEHIVLLECGMIQGRSEDEARNHKPFPVDPAAIDAVVLSHAHIDHSGRIPLLVRQGFSGNIYTQHATVALCEIMLPDSGFLHERDAEWQNKKRRKRGESYIKPLYTRADAEACLKRFRGVDYDHALEIVPGLSVRFRDAGHILGASIVELIYRDDAGEQKLVFSGDLGTRDSPVMRPPTEVHEADCVVLESTYGDRLHRNLAETLAEFKQVITEAREARGNILIPSFAVGRTQDLLYLFSKYWREWGLNHWTIYLDSPMAIQATEVYAKHRDLYDAKFFEDDTFRPRLPNLRMTRTPEESMAINQETSGAIIIAGSGMCTGGRIRHHLKNNLGRPQNHVVIVGFQAAGTLGRRLVDGADTVKIWGEEYAVRAQVHTIGGLSAHGDQKDLLDWYSAFRNSPPVYLVHGEPAAQEALALKLRDQNTAAVTIAKHGQRVELM